MGKKRPRDDAPAMEVRQQKEKKSKFLPVADPTTLRLPDGSEVFFLLYPSSFDLSRLEGAALPAPLLLGPPLGGAQVKLADGGSVRLAHAQGGAGGLLVAAVQPPSGAEGGAAAGAAEGGGEGGEQLPRVAFVEARLSGALALTLTPPVGGGAGALGLRQVQLKPREMVARRAHPRLKRVGF